jgi:hypothetical protein
MDDQMIKIRVISLGAGVQSTTMALMAAHGEISPMPDCAIFADTGWEPKAVYEHLTWVMSPNVLPFPVHVVRYEHGTIREHAFENSSPRPGRFAAIPWFVVNRDGSDGMGRRQCTSHYKLEPMRRKVRDLLSVGPKDRVAAGAVEKWIGISVDEIIRATPSRVKFEENRFPLIEKRMTRRDCLAWLERQGYPTPPKSACVGCPFHGDATWRDMRDNRPEEWADAVEVDKAIRDHGWRGFHGQQFMHRQRVPLDQVDLSTAKDRGQGDLFDHECEGMCGV